MRIRALAGAVVLLAACAGSGPEAPSPGPPEVACGAEVCVAYPGDWDVEEGDGYLGFSHPAAPEQALATAAVVNMEAIATAAGTTWPAPPEDVARAFWQLVEEGGGGELGALERLQGGLIESSGSSDGLRVWHLLVPIDATFAIGVEMRGPNGTWDSHADVFFSDVFPAP